MKEDIMSESIVYEQVCNLTMLDFRVAQDSILVPNIELPNCQLRKLGYKLIYSEFNIVKVITAAKSQIA